MTGSGDDVAPAGDVMMELVERAIPVIQSLPQGGFAADSPRPANAATDVATGLSEKSVPDDAARCDNGSGAAASETAAQMCRAVERLRTQQAQLRA